MHTSVGMRFPFLYGLCLIAKESKQGVTILSYMCVLWLIQKYLSYLQVEFTITLNCNDTKAFMTINFFRSRQVGQRQDRVIPEGHQGKVMLSFFIHSTLSVGYFTDTVGN